MSRIGKLPVPLPKGVKASLAGRLLRVEGPKGRLEMTVAPEISVAVEAERIVLNRQDESKRCKALHGTSRALVNNMVRGISEGFVKELEVVGVGYRVEQSGDTLTLALGHSHPIDYRLPSGVKGAVVKEGRDIFIRLEGSDRQQVGQAAAEIRKFRPPEIYKGKGVRYRGETIKLKAGKAGKK